MINLLYAGNKKVFDMIMISSLSASKTAGEPLHVFITTMDLKEKNPDYIPITEEQRVFLEKLINKYDKGSLVTLLDVTEIYKEKMFKSVNNVNTFTPYALLRLFADYYDLPDKIIYLDVDTVINNDINELFKEDIEGYEVGCVRDVYLLGQLRKRTYFNSGVLLLNMKEIRKTGYLEKARNICSKRPMIFMDQTALNLAVEKKKLLDKKFNTIHVEGGEYGKVVIHHMCDCRHHLICRYKSKDFETVKKYMPYYSDLIDEIIEIKKESDKI